MKKGTILLLSALWAFAGEYYYMNGDRRVELDKIPAAAAKFSMAGSPLYFRKPDGREIAIPNRLIVKFSSMENFETYLKMYGLKTVRKFGFGNMFLLEAKTPQKALEAANSLYEEPDVLFAQPDTVREWNLR